MSLISKVYNWIFRLLFRADIRDINSKPKIVLRSKYQLINLQSDDWFADAEMMIRAHGLNLKIGEIPIHFYSIEGPSSLVKPQAIWEFCKNLYIFRKKIKVRRKPASLVKDKNLSTLQK